MLLSVLIACSIVTGCASEPAPAPDPSPAPEPLLVHSSYGPLAPPGHIPPPPGSGGAEHPAPPYSFALFQLLHDPQQRTTDHASVTAPHQGTEEGASPQVITVSTGPAPHFQSNPLEQASLPGRDYYLVTQGYVTSPDNINYEIQGDTQVSTPNNNHSGHLYNQQHQGLVQHNKNSPNNGEPFVSTPIQYVIHHPHPNYAQNLNNGEVNKVNNAQVFTHLQAAKDETTLQESPREQHGMDQLTTPLITVFNEHNCAEDNTANSGSEINSQLLVSNTQKSRLYIDMASFDDIKVHDDRLSKLSYGQKTYKNYWTERERERKNSRNERFYISTTPSNFSKISVTEDGISRLVSSTQDLISNDDLLKINHAAEEQTALYNDDLIKPITLKVTKMERKTNNDYVNINPIHSRITVRAKIGKVVGSQEQIRVHKQDTNIADESFNSQDEYRFATPIIVDGSTSSDFKSQVVDNILSSVVPYLEDGYELTDVKHGMGGEENENRKNKYSSSAYESSEVSVTPRPVSNKFLAPLTVALRLINSNNSDAFNNVDEDHEVSDSELVSDSVDLTENLRKGKTIVEVQKSIPIEYTDINDIIIQYDDSRDGKKSQQDYKSLQDQYSHALESSRKIQDNMNQQLYRYGAQQVLIHPEAHRNKLEAEEKSQEYEESKDSRDNFDSSDTQTDAEEREEGESRNYEHKEFINAHHSNFGQKIIQPIIIEKEIPVTKFVDRFIEKKVPYKHTVEVVKEVEVEKPVPYPYPVEKYVDRPVEVTRFVDRPRDVHHHHAVPVEVNVPYMIEKKVYVDRPVHIAVPYEKVVEKTISVPEPVGVPVGVPVPIEKTVMYPVTVEKHIAVPVPIDRPVPVDRIVEKEVKIPYPVEKKVPYAVETKVPVPYLLPVEKRIPYAVDRIIDRPVTYTQFVEKPVEVRVPFPQPVAVPVPQPYAVDRIIEKRIPYPVDRVVEKIVEKKVQVPVPQLYTVDRVVEKRVPYPVDRIVEKVVEKKVEVPVRVNVPYPVDRVIERKVPVQVNVPYPVDRFVEKIVEKKVEVPVHINVPYPVDRVVEKIVTKYVDKPYPVEVKVPYEVMVPYPVEKFPSQEKHPSYAVPGPPYPTSSASQNHIDIRQPRLSNTNSAFSNTLSNTASLPPSTKSSSNYFNNSLFLPPPPAVTSKNMKLLTSSNFSFNSVKNVQSIPWGNVQATSYQSINPESFYKKSPNFGKYINYLTNNNGQYIVGSNVHNNGQTHSNNVYSNGQSHNNVVPNNLQSHSNVFNSGQKHSNVVHDNVQSDNGAQSHSNIIQYNKEPQNTQGANTRPQTNQLQLIEWKLRRSDRTPRLSQLRIEYGGFKPPLVPSTEVDLDGLPVRSETSH